MVVELSGSDGSSRSPRRVIGTGAKWRVTPYSHGDEPDRPFEPADWAGVGRLLIVAMRSRRGIGGSAISQGLSLGAAVVLGAILAPTDPVLAGDIGVGPPGDEDEREPNFSVTGEAGLNDGLAFPFLLLGLFIAAEPGTGWVGEWLTADVLYGIGAGAAIGVAIGYGLAKLAVELRDRRLLASSFDGWLAIPSVVAIYALSEIAGGLWLHSRFRRRVAFRLTSTLTSTTGGCTRARTWSRSSASSP